ncbi:MAG: flagellar basal body-associated FliL family protein [Treponema sp.]|nr:flagellar basal body-associated FliL family protein [Treponema sp.]
MSDNDELYLEGEEAAAGGGAGGAKKKASGLLALLPNLLKFVAIGLGALVFIVTVSVITYNILNKGGRAQTIIPTASPFMGTRPTFSAFTSIGQVRTETNDPIPFSVVVDMVIHFDLNDTVASNELTDRLHELRDFVRLFFRSRRADDMRPENEIRLRQEIVEHLNTRILNSARVRMVTFNQLDVVQLN